MAGLFDDLIAQAQQGSQSGTAPPLTVQGPGNVQAAPAGGLFDDLIAQAQQPNAAAGTFDPGRHGAGKLRHASRSDRNTDAALGKYAGSSRGGRGRVRQRYSVHRSHGSRCSRGHGPRRYRSVTTRETWPSSAVKRVPPWRPIRRRHSRAISRWCSAAGRRRWHRRERRHARWQDRTRRARGRLDWRNGGRASSPDLSNGWQLAKDAGAGAGVGAAMGGARPPAIRLTAPACAFYAATRWRPSRASTTRPVTCILGAIAKDGPANVQRNAALYGDPAMLFDYGTGLRGVAEGLATKDGPAASTIGDALGYRQAATNARVRAGLTENFGPAVSPGTSARDCGPIATCRMRSCHPS